MSRTLTAAALAVLTSLSVSTALAASAVDSAASAPTKGKAKVAARKPAKAAEPVSATNDSLNPGQLTAANRVLTGDAVCEFKQKVTIEKIAGHEGNFKLTFDHKSYIMVPEETTTGAVRLVDTAGAVVWVQIPMKSMLMNQREHHRMVDDCQADEQRIAVQASQTAAANAAVLAPAVAAPAAIAAAQGVAAQNNATVAVNDTTKVVPPAPARRGATAPEAAASGMWR